MINKSLEFILWLFYPSPILYNLILKNMADFMFFGGIFILAFLYSSVGHGGASGYLALMAVFSFSPEFMRPTALIMNIFVSSIALLSYYRGGHFRFKLLLPFIISSVPFAFLGGTINVHPKVYKIILGIFLIISILRMLFRPKNENVENKNVNFTLALFIGILLGFFSGLIGIGGGIILSPIIILLKWGNMKQTAAVSAAFILLNSIAGIIGQLTDGIHLAPETAAMLAFAVGGGFFGSWLGSHKLTNLALKYTLALVLSFASFKLLFF